MTTFPSRSVTVPGTNPSRWPAVAAFALSPPGAQVGPGRHVVLTPRCGALGNVSPSHLRNRKVNTHRKDRLWTTCNDNDADPDTWNHLMVNTRISLFFYTCRNSFIFIYRNRSRRSNTQMRADTLRVLPGCSNQGCGHEAGP